VAVTRGTTNGNSDAVGSNPATVTIPGSTGDYVVVSLSQNGGTATTPTGWTLLVSSTVTNPEINVYGRKLDGTEGSTLSITMSASLVYSIQATNYLGVHATPWGTTVTINDYSSSSTTNHIAPDIPSGSAGRMCVSGAGANTGGSSLTWTAASGFNVFYDSPGGKDQIDGDQATASAVTAPTWVISSGRAGAAWSGALAPAAGSTVVFSRNPSRGLIMR
jgi:hypothetical protein